MYPTPRFFHLVAGIVAIVVAVVSTWPVAAAPHDQVIDGARIINPKQPNNFAAVNIGADVFTTVWIINWMLHALVTQPLRMFDANIFYPAPLAIAYTEHMFATALLGAPGAVLVNPIFAHQSALLLCVVLNLWVTAYVVARWTGSLLGGIAAGTLFAVSPFHQSQIFHLQSFGTFYFPLIIFALERLGATGRMRWALLLGLSLGMQVLSGQYLAYMVAVTVIVAGAVLFLGSQRDESIGRRLGWDALLLAGAATIAIVIAIPFALPYLQLVQSGDIPDNKNVWLNSLFTLKTYLPRGSGIGPRFPMALWLLVGAGAITMVSGNRRRRVLALALIGVGWVGALLSLGPRGGSLYGVVAQWMPGFGSMREPYRFILLPSFVMAVLAGFGSGAVVRRMPRLGSVVVVLLVVAACYTVWRGPLPMRSIRTGAELPEVYKTLARCGDGDPLVEMPMGMLLDSWRDSVPQLYSTFHWLPLLNGRASYAPESMERVRRLVNVGILRSQWKEELRRVTGVRWILVHCDFNSPQVQTLCKQETWPDVPSRYFPDSGVRLFDLGRVENLPRPIPRREPATVGCLQ